jgi:hypothetical protein
VNRRALGGLLLAGLALAGCKLPSVSPEADAFAKTFFKDLQRADWAAVQDKVAPEAAGALGVAQMQPIAAMIPKGEPTSVKTVGWRVNAGTGGETVGLDHVYAFPNQTVRFSVNLRKLGPNRFAVLGFNVNLSAPQAPSTPAAPGKGPRTSTI